MAKIILREYPKTLEANTCFDMDLLFKERDNNFSYDNSPVSTRLYTINGSEIKVVTKGFLQKEVVEGDYTIELNDLQVVSAENFRDISSKLEGLNVDEVSEILGVYNIQERLDTFFDKSSDARNYIDPLNNPGFDKFIPGLRRNMINTLLRDVSRTNADYILLGPSVGKVLEESPLNQNHPDFRFSSEQNLEGYISLTFALLKK
jgi:hypothetical protein